MSSFVPRKTYPISALSSIPRSYYLGHHAAGLSKMRSLLSSIDLVIECRDYRTPFTSRNPLFEEHLGERPRLIVYTKQDLGSNYTVVDQARNAVITKWLHPTPVKFGSITSRSDIAKVLSYVKEFAEDTKSFFPSKMMVVGMPNVGKSSLLNALRNYSLNKGKAARTGDQPGVTRKIGTSVKIIEADEKSGREGVYVLDTPGVFVPYVPDAESMLKLALCGSVKDTIIPPTTIADYLLYHLNLHDSTLYDSFCSPTNEISEVLEGLARKQGRLKKGGIPDVEAAALLFIQRWRSGRMGRFVLDEVTDEAVERNARKHEEVGGSMNQARKAAKVARKMAYVDS